MRALLVSLPFSPFSPSSQLGVLAGHLRDQPGRSYEVETAHLFVHLAARVGLAGWEGLSNTTWGTRVGNLLFQRHLLGLGSRDAADLLGADWLDVLEADGTCDRMAVARWQQAVDTFWEDLLAGKLVDLDSYHVVGFSTVFNQLFPSLALARALKERRPDCFTVFGGVEVHGECGGSVLARFPCVDAVVQGRGELPLHALLTELAAGRAGRGLPGVATRDPEGTPLPAPPRPADEEVVFGRPDHGEFFETLAAAGLPAEACAGVPVEASQGCHWRRCDFCGTREVFPRYRVKPAAAIREEVERAVARHGVFHVVLTDEAVPVRRLVAALGGLADEPWAAHVAFLAQIRASFTREQIEALAGLGLRVAQVGIESFSTPVLRAMDKGVTALDNLRCLKWCQQHGVAVDYNLILGYPDSAPEELERQAAAFPLFVHLDPPQVSDFYLNRFSLRFCRGARDGGAAHRPSPLYNADLFPEELSGLAFVANEPADAAPAPGEAALVRALALWQERYRPGLLTYLHGKGFVEVQDRRGPRRRGMRLRGLVRDVFLFCDDVRREEEVREEFGAEGERAVAAAAELARAGLLYQDGDAVLSLVPRFPGRVDWR